MLWMTMIPYRCTFVVCILAINILFTATSSAEVEKALPVPKSEANVETAAIPSSKRPSTRSIEVSGDAWGWAGPDLARITFSLQESGNSAGALNSSLDRKVAQILEKIRKEIDPSIRSTERDNSYDPEGKGAALVSNSPIHATRVVGVETAQLSKVAGVIDTLLRSDAVVRDVRYLSRNREDLRIQTVVTATERAKTLAKQVAGSLGVELGGVLETTVVEEPVEQLERMEQQRGDSSFLYNDNDLHVYVTLRYEISS